MWGPTPKTPYSSTACAMETGKQLTHAALEVEEHSLRTLMRAPPRMTTSKSCQ